MFHRKRHHNHTQQRQQQQQQQQQEPKPQMPSQQHLRSSSVGSRSTSDSNASLIVMDDTIGDSTSSQVGQLTATDNGMGSTIVAKPGSSSNSLKLMTIEGFRRRSTSPVCPKTVQMAAQEAFRLSSEHSPVRKPKSSPASPARATNHSLATSPDTHSSSSSSSLTGLFRRKARSPFELSASQSFSLPPPRPHRNHHVSSANNSTQNSGYHACTVLEPKGRSLSPLPSPGVDENQFTRGRKISNIRQPPPMLVLNADQLDSSAWQTQPSLLSLIDSRQISFCLFVYNQFLNKESKEE